MGAGIVATFGLLALGYLAAAVFAGADVPRRTTVAGVDIGGKSATAAEAKLREGLSAATDRPVRLTANGAAGNKVFTIAPDSLGLRYDVPATVAAAKRGRFAPAAVLGGLFGGREISPHVATDRATLTKTVATLAEKVDEPVREGSVRFAGLRPEPVWPRPGRKLDRAGAEAAVRAAFLAGDRRARLPVATVQPKTSRGEVQRAVNQVAAPAVAAPVALTARNRTVSLPPRVIAANLAFAADSHGRLAPRLDGAGIVEQLGTRLDRLGRLAKDATFVVRDGRPRVVPARAGERVDEDALAAAVIGKLTRPAPRTAEVKLRPAAPRLSTAAARRLGIKEKISSFTTHHPCCAPRVTNIHRIADIVDGHVVRPGQTFSLNGLVGRRDRERGFVSAPMILNGRFVDDVGGGVSQFATTTFNAVFFGGLQDVTHSPHTYYISRYPAGREATVSFPQPDLKFRNDSPYGVLITTSYTGTSVTVTFWSTKRYDIESKSSARTNVRDFPTENDSGPDCEPMGGAEGFEIDVWRIFKRDGRVLRKQKFHTTYAAEPRVICGTAGG